VVRVDGVEQGPGLLAEENHAISSAYGFSGPQQIGGASSVAGVG
jgi:hypothetical protein